LAAPKVVLVGTDAPLLEGVAQTLVGFGYEVSLAAGIPEIPIDTESPLLVVVSSKALDESAGATMPFTAGSALIVYGSSHSKQPFLSPRLQRSTLAYLVLPLERHRLVALAQAFAGRCRKESPAVREEREEDAEFWL
jgi:hypothetical protein